MVKISMVNFSANTRAERIHTLLVREITPAHILLVDESAQHHGHKGVQELKKQLIEKQDAEKSDNEDLLETHFSLEISATALQGLSRVQQHQLIYNVISNEFNTGLHSLKIKII